MCSSDLIGAIGRMVPVKGYDVFITAAKEILYHAPQTKFVLTGDGPMLSKLKELSLSLGLKDKIVFTGYRNDPIDIMNALDIFVISSYHEGIPTVVLEAMALRIPVIATEVGGIPEIIEHKVSGLLVHSKTSKAIASTVNELLHDESLRNSLVENAFKYLNEEYISEVQNKRILNLYNEIVG